MNSTSDTIPTPATGTLPRSTAHSAHPHAAAHARTGKAKKIWQRAALVIVTVLVLTWVGRLVYHAYHYVETDDAYVVGHLHQIGPRVEGRVAEVLVRQNQFVDAGAPLVKLDPLEFQLAVQKAQATLDQARAQEAQVRSAATEADAHLTEAHARVKQAQAQFNQTSAQLDLAKVTLERNENLFARGGVVAQSDLDNARAAFRAADAAYAANQANVAAAESSVGSARAAQASAHAEIAAAAANVAVAESALRDARRKLDYATLTAPTSGRVGNKNVEVGNYVLPGQILLSIAESDAWIVANFKETQLAEMRPGQPVDVTIDAIPGHDLHGTIESLSPASGAQFALLPPDNATGNFNKVVQRVPVKILLDPAGLREVGDRLRLGLSAVVNVRVR